MFKSCCRIHLSLLESREGLRWITHRCVFLWLRRGWGMRVGVRGRPSYKTVLVMYHHVVGVCRFYIVLFSTRLTALLSHVIPKINEWLAFCSAFLNIRRSGVLSYRAVWLLNGWCHVKLLLSRSAYTIQSWTMSRRFTQSQVRRAHTCLAITCHLRFWAEWPGAFMCYSGNTCRVVSEADCTTWRSS